MTQSANEIIQLCRTKEQELMEKYFGNLVKEAAYERPESVGKYTPDLPLTIGDEYKAFLEQLWLEVAPDNLKGTPLVLEEAKLRELSTANDRERVTQAYKKATTQTLWESITKSNHKDVTEYKFLLKEYTSKLLSMMRIDFMEEITGDHISCKTFEEE